jgi:hypothetical protein
VFFAEKKILKLQKLRYLLIYLTAIVLRKEN